MSTTFIPYDIYIPVSKHSINIYLKNTQTINSINTATNTTKKTSTSKHLQVTENGIILKFKISYTTLHLLYKYLRNKKHIQKLYIHCKYIKYKLDDIIIHFQNLQDILKIKHLIFII